MRTQGSVGMEMPRSPKAIASHIDKFYKTMRKQFPGSGMIVKKGRFVLTYAGTNPEDVKKMQGMAAWWGINRISAVRTGSNKVK